MLPGLLDKSNHADAWKSPISFTFVLLNNYGNTTKMFITNADFNGNYSAIYRMGHYIQCDNIK